MGPYPWLRPPQRLCTFLKMTPKLSHFKNVHSLWGRAHLPKNGQKAQIWRAQKWPQNDPQPRLAPQKRAKKGPKKGLFGALLTQNGPP